MDKKRTNSFAIVGFVLSFFSAVLGLIFSIIGLAKYNDYKSGKGLSIAGIIISGFKILFAIAIFFLLILSAFVVGFSKTNNANIRGEWVAYKVEYKDEEIPMSSYFGICDNITGYLTLKDDNTFSLVSPCEDSKQESLSGTYNNIANFYIRLKIDSAKAKSSIYVKEDGIPTIILDDGDYIVFYHRDDMNYENSTFNEDDIRPTSDPLINVQTS